MNPPRRLRVGSSLYRVRRMRAPRDDVFGEIDADAALIEIAPGLSPQTVARTLVHEALHACFAASGLGGDPRLARLEERIVAGLEEPVAQLIADNPAFTEFIRSRLKK